MGIVSVLAHRTVSITDSPVRVLAKSVEKSKYYHVWAESIKWARILTLK